MFLNDVIRLGEKKTTILPRIQEVCNGLPYHDMYGIGWANLVDRNTNKSYITLGQGWQCKNCYYVLVTEGNPTYFYPQKIGKYGGTKYSEPVGTHVSNIYTTYCGYCDGTKLEGYKFNKMLFVKYI